MVSFTDKTRYLFQIAKGIVGPESRSRPFDVNKLVPPRELRIPFDRMVFVGDGYTDIPCFTLVKTSGETALAVYDPSDCARWGRAWGFVEDRRVSSLLPARYGVNDPLFHSLLMAVERRLHGRQSA